ncbi:MAG: hypothetical protein ACJ76F_12110 [Bacteroidia bacterium]
MLKRIKIILLFSGFAFLFFTSFSPGPEKEENMALKLILSMLDSIKNIRTMSFQLKAMERV